MYLVYDVTMQMIKAANKNKEFLFTPTKSEDSERMTFKVKLGIMPDYAFDGPGVRADGTNPGEPADKAGIKKGDVIIKIGDYTISSMMDYMGVLGKFNKGETTTVIVKRNGEEITLTLTF
jgi:S1-C subfamily serine protease